MSGADAQLSSPQSCRLPTVSASQALRGASTSSSASVSTGLPRLDEAIAPNRGLLHSIIPTNKKGLPRGHVTEVYGAPGAGKTTLGMSVAVDALQSGGKVVWIDTGSPIPRRRLKEMLQEGSASETQPENSSSQPVLGDADKLSENLIYFRAPTLPHLLALLLHPPQGFPPEGVSVMVVDSISSLFPSYFETATTIKNRRNVITQGTYKRDITSWLVGRKWSVMQDVVTKLGKLAAEKSFPVFIINQARSKFSGPEKPILQPQLQGRSWDPGIHTRIVLYSHWPTAHLRMAVGTDQEGQVRAVRHAEVVKRNGKHIESRSWRNITPFEIRQSGIHEIRQISLSSPATPEGQLVSREQLLRDLQSAPQVQGSLAQPAISQQTPSMSRALSQRGTPIAQMSTSPLQRRPKRKVQEIADSEDEDDDSYYGWSEEDEDEMNAVLAGTQPQPQPQHAPSNQVSEGPSTVN